jgi:hypothetical protein
MITNFLGAWDSLAAASPCILALLLLIVYFHLAPRTRGRRAGKRRRHTSAFSASTFSIGMALQHLEQIMRPEIQHQIHQIYEEDADQEESGDPDHPKAQLHRQLKRIRRGEEIDRLILRLK